MKSIHIKIALIIILLFITYIVGNLIYTKINCDKKVREWNECISTDIENLDLQSSCFLVPDICEYRLLQKILNLEERY